MTEPGPYPGPGWKIRREWPAKLGFFLRNRSDGLRRWCYRQVIDFRFRHQLRYTALWDNPAVIYAFPSGIGRLAPLPRGSLLLVALDWTHEDPARRAATVGLLKGHFPASAGARVVALTNTAREAELISADGIEAIHLNHNAFLDERVFSPDPSAIKRYDAIYDAALLPYKRHSLASEVESLALISYMDRPSPDMAYARRMHRLLPHATWINDPASRSYRRLSIEEVSAALNASRVGLCLSEAEGAMFASGQYLLCGLPVVTTPSAGGRDEFFEPEFTLTVPPTAGDVAAGVRMMAERRLDPNAIRQATLSRMLRLRRNFVDLIQAHLQSQGVATDFSAHFSRVFFHTLLKHRRVPPARRPQ